MMLTLRCMLKALLVTSVLLAVVSVAVDSQAASLSASSTQKHTLVIGKISSNPKKHYRYLKPIADYAVKHMQDLGIQEAKVLMAKDNRQMINYLRQGRIDWVTETAFSAVLFEKKASAEMLVRKWKKGVPEYHTIFFVRKDSGINTLDDLKGKTIAFEDSGSTSAYYAPAALLIDRGLQLAQLGSLREKPSPDTVGYAFSGAEINTSTWVHKGLVDAGAYSNLDWNKEDHLPKAFRKDFKIIYQSKPFPRAIELVRKGLDPMIKQRLKEVLLNAHEDPHAKSALRAYQKTKKFDEIDESVQEGIQAAGKIIKIVQAELEY